MTKNTVGANGIRPVRQEFHQCTKDFDRVTKDFDQVCRLGFDRSFFDSLASRVNAIDPYGIPRHPKLQRTRYFT